MNKPLYYLVSIIAFVACAHYYDHLLFNVIFAFIGGSALMSGFLE